jgi:hypothetical protein
MTMKERHDGSKYPDSDAEDAVLADFTDGNGKTGHGYSYNRTLGDLIVDALVGRDLNSDSPEGPEYWESFEHGLLTRTALEIRAINHALASEITTDDHPADEVSIEEACELLRGLARRVEASAEIAVRLRRARWGAPEFGGGENLAAEARATREALKSNGAEHAEGSAE